MQYQLDTVIQIIKTSLLPHHLPAYKEPEVMATKKCEEVIEYIHESKTYLKPLLTGNHETELRGLIPQYQYDITRLLNILYRITKTKLPDEFTTLAVFAKNCYYAIMQALKLLMRYLNQYFGKYLDMQQRIPEYYRVRVSHTIEEEIIYIRQQLLQHTIDEALKAELCLPLDFFCSQINAVSYNGLKYLQSYIARLHTLAAGKGLDDAAVRIFLLSVRFNHEAFYRVLIGHIRAQAGQHSDSNALLEFYHQQAKIIRQCTIENIPAFDTNKPDIITRVDEWLQEEIFFLERRVSNCSSTAAPGFLKTNAQKIRVSLTVQELSLALRFLMDTRIIEENNFTLVAKKLTSAVITVKSDSLSLDSFINKSRSVNPVVLNRLIDKIIRLLNMAQAART